MKKMLLALSLLAAHHLSYGQTTVFFSDMDGFGSEIDKCSGRLDYCPTFDIMCTSAPGTCSSTSPVGRWYRIGTPHKVATPTPSRIGMVASGSNNNITNELGDCEGLFTKFNFVPGKTYKIHIGIAKMDLYPGSDPSAVSASEAALKLYAGNELNETIGDVCCQEPYLWVFSLGSSTILYNTYNWTTWANNNSQSSTNANAVDLIGSINPGLFWSGVTKDYAIVYTVPTSGVIPTIFAFHTYLNADKISFPGVPGLQGKNQVDFEIDYVKIEEVCNYNSNFNYEYSTLNPLDVDFYPATWGAPAPYNWQYGDGGTSASSTNHSHTYPALGTYIPSLAIADCHREVAKLCLNEPVVYNYIPEGHPVNTPQEPCNPHFRVMGSSQHQSEIGVTVLGNHSGVGAFKVSWGDGTTSTSIDPESFVHRYSTIGNYTICVKADNERCSTCIDICIDKILNIEDGDGDGEHGGGGVGQGKSGVTSIKNAELFEIISINPNPASAVVNINLESPSNNKVEINVFDITGKRVINTENMLIQGKNKIELDVKMLAAGTYIIEMKSGNNNILRAKMTKE